MNKELKRRISLFIFSVMLIIIFQLLIVTSFASELNPYRAFQKMLGLEKKELLEDARYNSTELDVGEEQEVIDWGDGSKLIIERTQ